MDLVHVINLILIFYIIPAMISYVCVRWMYTYVYKYTKPGMGHIFFVLCPGVNIISTLIDLIEIASYKSKGHGKKIKKGPSISEVFFRLKKEE